MANKTIREKALELLNSPRELQQIPIERVNSALNISASHVGHEHYMAPIYLSGKKTIYLIIPKKAMRYGDNTFDSPVFQTPKYNYVKPLWQEFREAFEQAWGNIKVDLVFFGNWKQVNKKDTDFEVADLIDETTEWVLIKKANVSEYNIVHLMPDQRATYQKILNDLRLKRAIGIVKDNENRRRSRLCRAEGITSLDVKYHNEFEVFTFGEETFRFRQFTNEFLYTKEGLAEFDRMYEKVYKPYRIEEAITAEWKEKSKKLNEILFSSEEFQSDLLRENASHFKISFREDGCVVDGDIFDDRAGHQLHKVIQSQEDDVILNTLGKELGRIFERKAQIRHASEHLQELAVRY